MANPRRNTLIVVLLLLGAASAALLIRQDIATTPAAVGPDVTFAQGTDYASINTAGFATLTLGTSGASATLSVTGVAGAASTELGDLLKIVNGDATQAYTVTLGRSAALDTDVTAFTVEVYDSLDTLVESWDAKADAASASFSLPALTTYDITVKLAIADGVAAGNQDAFDLQVSLVPV